MRLERAQTAMVPEGCAQSLEGGAYWDLLAFVAEKSKGGHGYGRRACSRAPAKFLDPCIFQLKLYVKLIPTDLVGPSRLGIGVLKSADALGVEDERFELGIHDGVSGGIVPGSVGRFWVGFGRGSKTHP